jgi:hypothetical protein
MKKSLAILGLIILVLLVAAGSFWGGMKYESSRADQVRASFINARGQANGSPFLQEGQLPVGEIPYGLQGGGGTTGQVKTIEGNIMTISTAQDVTTVQLTDDTQIGKSVTATIADLKPGLRVRITGERDKDGKITAGQITILSEDLAGGFLPGTTDP